MDRLLDFSELMRFRRQRQDARRRERRGLVSPQVPVPPLVTAGDSGHNPPPVDPGTQDSTGSVPSSDADSPAPNDGSTQPPPAEDGLPLTEEAIASMTVPQLKDALSDLGVEIPANAKKADLQELLASAAQR